MTFPGELSAPTLTGLSDLSSAAMSFATPTLGSIDPNTLSSFGDAYESYLATAYETATGSVKSALGSAQDILSSADRFFSTATGEVPAVVAAPTSTDLIGTKETSSTTTRRTPTTSTAQSTTSPTPQSQPASGGQSASGAERGVSSVWFGGVACAGLVIAMGAL